MRVFTTEQKDIVILSQNNIMTAHALCTHTYNVHTKLLNILDVNYLFYGPTSSIQPSLHILMQEKEKRAG